MPLTTKYRQQLKAKAHPLKPIVFIGNHGFSDAVKNEIERALDDHELIKVRIQVGDRHLRKELFAEICLTHKAEAVQLIGNIGVIYRPNLEK
jgi:RNA-binding protein